ncbi:nucleotidyltransferase domain-containing protein [Enterococcus sp. LJL99]
MKKIIQEKLKEIEKQEDVKIILAVESGSRAWGFESKDSDYDVRFLYVRKPESYLKLEGVRDVIEWQLDDVLDINGWDIQKALRLLYKSNPTLFEWCASPIIYQQTVEVDELKKLLKDYFSEKKSLFHYWHMADSNYREYLKTARVKAKKYFYVLRPILASKWIINYQEAPPIEFTKLVDALMEEELKTIVIELLEEKKQTNELDWINKIDVLNDYIEKELPILRKIAEETLDKKHSQWVTLNEFFLQLVL